MTRRTFALTSLLPLLARAADETSVNPKIAKILAEVSEDSIRKVIEKLVSFETRNTMSNPGHPTRGIGAARQWILAELQSYSPRLTVSFDKYRVKKQGQRIFKDVDLWNVVAVLPGTKYPETQVIVSGHYDTLNLGPRPSAGPAAAGAPGGAATQTPEALERNAELPAPGACDDGSGTAAVMELARVMSKYEFDKTLVFVAFAGEEQGLIGSTLMAARARKENQVIEAVLNNDIIGTDVSGNGRMSNNSVNIYSDETMDSVSQQLSRYIRDVAHRYIPAMRIDNIFMGDRLGRGGDHTPFQWEGYAAVRFSTPNEDYSNQHRATDTLDKMSVPYTTRVARVNAAAAASLALAPKPPLVTAAPGGRSGANPPAPPPAEGAPQTAGAGRGGRGGGRGPMIARGGGYDAVLRWRPAGDDSAIKGYVVLTRPTTAPYWEQEIYVGKVTEYTLKDVSIDDTKFGVKAIGIDGAESLVTAYVPAPRQKATIETVQQ
jgi:hypothetical protein